MLDRSLRPLKSAALAPVADRLAGAVPPMAITGFGLVIGLGAAALAAAGWWFPALVAWLANRVLDGLDGEVARVGGSVTDRGGYLDLAADATVYAAIPLGVAAGIDHPSAWVVAAALLAAFYVNIVTVTVLSAIWEKREAGAAARGEQTSVALPIGLIEGSETIVGFALLLALPDVAIWTMLVLASAVAVTAVCRTAAVWPHLGSDPADTVRRSPATVEAR